jgi:WD40 repeat protein
LLARLLSAGIEAMVVGETISGYRLLEKLGSDPNGASFVAEDGTAGRNVVVQFLSEVLAGHPETLRRFVHAAQTLADESQLESTILGIEQVDGRRFLVLTEEGGRQLLEPLLELEAATLRSMQHAKPLKPTASATSPDAQATSNEDATTPVDSTTPVSPTMGKGAAHQPDAPFAPGEILGERYRIIGPLGRGGMGEVWHAFDLKLQVEVALKALRREQFPDEDAFEVLRHEVRSGREVISPNVCRIYDLIFEKGQELLSMEYVDGRTITELLRATGPLNTRDAGQIASQFLAGLEAIHETGLVHRDIKPENVMVTRTGRVIVMDFGIALVVRAQAADLAGTPAYMAPEVMRGETPDARADIFAAGMVLAELIASDGDSESRQWVRDGIRENPPRLPDGPWQEVLQRAVALDPKACFASVREFAHALEELTPRAMGADNRNPYPGLAAFSDTDSEFFFGREAEVEAVWKKLQRSHFLAVIGASGAGKTSFLQAGLVPTKPDDWGHVLCRPKGTPLLSLAQALAPHFAEEKEAVARLLRFQDVDVAVSTMASWRQRHAQALLIVDQFEELFTQCSNDVQARFATVLGRLVEEADVHVLLGMRDDFLIHCKEHPDLEPLFSDLTALGPLAGNALRRALVQPALACGYRFESEELVEEMLDTVRGERGALPLLAFAVSQLWEERERETGRLTRRGYETIGGVSGALARHAEATLSKTGVSREPIVREIFRNLVTARGTRSNLEIGELFSVFGDAEAATEVLRELVAARLLTTYEVEGRNGDDGSSSQRVEVVHESLFTAWPRLVRWQTQDADGAQLRDQLRQAARMWEERGRPDDLLWTGTPFQEFQVWRARYPGGLTATEEAFARAMTAKALRLRKRRRRILVSAFGVLLAVMSGFGVLAYREREARRRAQASELLAMGRLVPEEDTSQRLAYAIASLELENNDQVRHFAMEALSRGPTAQVIPSKDVLTVDLSPDGRKLIFGQWTSKATGWFADGTPLQVPADSTLPNQLPWGYPRFAFDSEHVIGPWTSSDGKLRFWSLSQQEVVGQLEFQDWTIVGWSPNRRYLTTRTPTAAENGAFLVQTWVLDRDQPRLLGKRLVTQTSADLTAREFALGGLGITGCLAAVDPTGTWLVYSVGRELVRVEVANMETQPHEVVVGGHDDTIHGIEIHPDGERVAAIDRSGQIRIWSLSKVQKAPLRTFFGPQATYVGLRFDATGKWLSVSYSTGATHVWDLHGLTDRDPLVLRVHDSDSRSAAFTPDGAWIATANRWRPALWALDRRYPQKLRGHNGKIQHVVFAPDGEWLGSVSNDGTVRTWQLSPKARERSRVLVDIGVSNMWAVNVDPEGRFLFVQDHDAARIVRLEDGTVRRIDPYAVAPTGPGARAHAAIVGAVGPQGRYVAEGLIDIGRQIDHKIRIHDLETGDSWLLRIGDEGEPRSLNFAPDGTLLASYSDGRLFSWNVQTRTPNQLRNDVQSFALSGDGRLLLGLRRGRATLHDLESGTARDLETHGTRIVGVAMDPAATIVVTADVTSTLRVGPANGDPPHVLVGHDNPIAALAVDPKRRWIASTEEDSNLIWLWPIPQGRPLNAQSPREFLETLRLRTNLRIVRDEASLTGYKTEPGSSRAKCA